jgi:hypothetical protein
MHDFKKQYKFKEVDGKLVLDEIVYTEVDYTTLEKLLKHIKKNKILYARIAFSLAYGMFLAANPTLAFAYATSPISWIEEMGNGAISVLQATAVKLLTGGMILELCREGLRGGTHNITQIIITYALLMLAILLAPTFVSVIQSFAKSYRP